jgi:hypothetical protein
VKKRGGQQEPERNVPMQGAAAVPSVIPDSR